MISSKKKLEMNEKKLISILLPTYKRPLFLETMVTCLINQIKKGGLEEAVEIIIGNDASRDQTDNYIDEIKKQYKFVRGFNHQKNLGLSKNIESLLKEALSEHILICGDDDLLREGAIEYFQRDYKMLSNINNWMYLTNLLPSVIFRKDLFLEEEASAKKHLRSENLYLWQAQVLIGISKYGRFLIIAKPFVLHRKNETSWTQDSRSIVFFNIFDNEEVANVIKEYIPSEYKNYKKLYAAFTMGGLMLDTLHGKDIRNFAWITLSKNLFYFPENLQFLSMVIAPKLITKISPVLRQFKNKKYFFK